jgi:hypothetical protein
MKIKSLHGLKCNNNEFFIFIKQEASKVLSIFIVVLPY